MIAPWVKLMDLAYMMKEHMQLYQPFQLMVLATSLGAGRMEILIQLDRYKFQVTSSLLLVLNHLWNIV